MMKKVTLLTSMIIFGLVGFSQEETDDGLTDQERAFSDSIAAVNTASAENAEAMGAYNDGIKAFKAKNYSSAIQNFDKAIAGSPDFIDAHFNRGMAQMEGGKEKDAITTFNKVLTLDASNSKACIKKGECYTSLGDYKMAISSYEQGAKIDPKNEKIPYAIGDVYFLGEHYEIAIEQFTKAITLKPDYAYAYN
ncbi:MAG: tetratricopeptide repeat protein, partial [Flavobacteriales bacterium]|nr:tetratricopeptide repeat protein [Flavobacteriales bacterium]